MKRFAWAALLLGIALTTAGCQKPGAGGAADQPADAQKFVVPEDVDGKKVADAMGKALLKGLNASPPKTPPPSEPPSFER